MVKNLVTWYKGFPSFQFGSAAATFSLDVVTARIIQTNFLRQRSQRRLCINYAWSPNFHLRVWKKAITCGKQIRNRWCVPAASASAWNSTVPVGMEESAESGSHKHSILRNKEVPKNNAPHKPRDVTRPTVMVKRYGFRGTLSIKYKIDLWNNPITASVLVWNQVVLNQSQQLGYLNSKLMLSWDCPFKGRVPPSWHIIVFTFLQQQPHHNVSLCYISRYSAPGTRIPKLVFFCHRKWFASLFCVLVILPINLTSSSQFWRKLLFFLRRVTYFVLAKQMWIPYDQNTIFYFVEFQYEGKKLPAYAEKRVCTIYLHMETLAKSWSQSIHICFGNTELVTIFRKNNNLLEYWQDVVKFIANIAEKDNRDANHWQRSWWHQSSTLTSDYALQDNYFWKWTTGPHWDVVALVKTVLCQKGDTLPLRTKKPRNVNEDLQDINR